eukprot:scaffold7641_cov115-Cylindrotheca_fusiformis.AAC.2
MPLETDLKLNTGIRNCLICLLIAANDVVLNAKYASNERDQSQSQKRASIRFPVCMGQNLDDHHQRNHQNSINSPEKFYMAVQDDEWSRKPDRHRSNGNDVVVQSAQHPRDERSIQGYCSGFKEDVEYV